MTPEEITKSFQNQTEKYRKNLFFKVHQINEKNSHCDDVQKKERLLIELQDLIDLSNYIESYEKNGPNKGQVYRNKFKEEIWRNYKIHKSKNQSNFVGSFVSKDVQKLKKKHLEIVRSENSVVNNVYYHDIEFLLDFNIEKVISWLAKCDVWHDIIEMTRDEILELQSGYGSDFWLHQIDQEMSEENQKPLAETESNEDNRGKFRTKKDLYEELGMSKATFYKLLKNLPKKYSGGKLSPDDYLELKRLVVDQLKK